MTAKILVIDDDDGFRRFVTTTLAEDGYEVRGATDGNDGLQQLTAGFDAAVVVTDIIMPHKEGIETIIEIRRERPAQKILAISGGGPGAGTTYLSMAKQLGADAVLTKPFLPNDLLATVGELLK